MSPYSILIVDDEANQRFMLEQALRAIAYNWNITTAASGQEALEALASHTPDLIITDYNMPLMNGLDLIARVREGRVVTRIILITAYSSPELYEAAQRLQIDHCLTKPVPLALLRRVTSSVLETAPLQLD